jgi:predicted RNase H-like nuclease (RuvC/YqgF family)
LQGQVEVSNRVATVPGTARADSNIEDIIQAMSQLILKTREIKSLKGIIEKMKKEMKMKDENIAQVQKENQDLQERVNKLKTRLRGKVILQGAKHVIWYAIVFEAAKFKVCMNFINDKDNMAITA